MSVPLGGFRKSRKVGDDSGSVSSGLSRDGHSTHVVPAGDKNPPLGLGLQSALPPTCTVLLGSNTAADGKGQSGDRGWNGLSEGPSGEARPLCGGLFRLSPPCPPPQALNSQVCAVARSWSPLGLPPLTCAPQLHDS